MKFISALFAILLFCITTAGCESKKDYPKHIKTGINLYNQGNVLEAKAEFVRSIKCYDGSALAHYLLGLSLLDLGKFEQAGKEFGRAGELRPDWEWPKILCGLLSVLSSDYNLTETLFQNILKDDPNRQEALQLLGFHYESTFQLEKAIDVLERAYRNNPGNVFSGNNLAFAYIWYGNYQGAVRVLNETIARYPKANFLYSVLARTHSEYGYLRKAEEVFISTPDKEFVPRVWLELAELYRITGERDKALDAYDNAVKYFPKRLDLYEDKAKIYQEMGNREKAREEYEKMKYLDPKTESWAMGLGEICLLEGNTSCAVEYYKQALELSPKNQNAINALKNLGVKSDYK